MGPDYVGPVCLSRDAAVFLTPPFNEGHHLEALRLTEADADSLPANSGAVAPTTDRDVKDKVEDVWDAIQARAVEAARIRQELAGSKLAQGPPKRPRTSPETSGRAEAEDDVFALFGRTKGVQESTEEEGDPVEQMVRQELSRYKALAMSTKDVSYSWQSV